MGRPKGYYPTTFLIGLAILLVGLTGCHDEEAFPKPSFDTGLSIDEALERPTGEIILVNGWLTNATGNTRLCSTLNDRDYSPPGCGDPSIATRLSLDGASSLLASVGPGMAV